MSLGQLSSRGKQNNKLYMVDASINTTVDGKTTTYHINFYTKQKIETSSELFNYLRNNGYNSINKLPVYGSGYTADYRIYCINNLYFSNYNPDRIAFTYYFFQNINGTTTAGTTSTSHAPYMYTIKCFEVI